MKCYRVQVVVVVVVVVVIVVADAFVSAVVVACRGKRSPNYIYIYNNSRSTGLAAVMLVGLILG